MLLGGAAGALARAGLPSALAPTAGAWPWPTWLASLVGAALLGWLGARLAAPPRSPGWVSPLLGSGFCGALTTFSTLQVETIALVAGGHELLALAYVGSSMVLGMALAAGFAALGRRR